MCLVKRKKQEKKNNNLRVQVFATPEYTPPVALHTREASPELDRTKPLLHDEYVHVVLNVPLQVPDTTPLVSVRGAHVMAVFEKEGKAKKNKDQWL